MILCCVGEAIEEEIDREEEETPSAVPAAASAASSAVTVLIVLLATTLCLCFADCRRMVEREYNNAGRHRPNNSIFPERIPAPEECHMEKQYG